MGKGNKPNKAEMLSEEDMEKFWALGLLGDGSPRSLQDTLFVFFVCNLGMRPNHCSHQLCWGDITLKTDSRKCIFVKIDPKNIRQCGSGWDNRTQSQLQSQAT